MSDGRILASGAHRRAEERLLRADKHIRPAFEALDLGWTLEDVETWLEDTPTWQQVPNHLRGQVVGMVMAFGLVVIERDREP